MSRWARHRARRRELLGQRRLERHQVWTGEPTAGHRAWWRFADATDLFWARGLLVAMVTWLFLVGFSSIDFFTYQDVPVEDVVVVSVGLSPTETVACDRLGLDEEPAEVVTYRTLTPRQGYPDEFSRSTCPGADEKVGDQIRVVRTEPHPDYVFPYPIETAAQLWTWPLGAVLVAGLLATVGFLVRQEWHATPLYERWQRHEARMAALPDPRRRPRRH